MASSELELNRSHLATARAALIRRYGEGRNPDSIEMRALEAIVSDLEAKVSCGTAQVLSFNGVEYADDRGSC